MGVLLSRWVAGRMIEYTYGWKGEWMAECVNGRVDDWMDG